MDENEILKRLRTQARENLDYFSNSNKPARERWPVELFLSILKVPYQVDELRSPEQHSKVDVEFRDASFQVKELANPNLLRGKMYKDAYNSVKAARTLDDISLVGDAYDIPPSTRMYELVVQMAKELSASPKYSDTKSELDLLVYVTRTRAALIRQDEIDSEEFLEYGWRSVSCVNEKQAVILFSSTTAPAFLQKNSGILINASG